MADLIPSSYQVQNKGYIAWAPLLDSHNPNPPINLVDSTNYSQQQEVLISSKPSIGLAALTIAVCLLQSTLAPVKAATVYDNPVTRPKVIAQTWVNNNLQNTLVPSGAAPFKQNEWPNPTRIKSQILVDISTSIRTPDASLGISCPITLGIGAPGDISCFTLVGLEPNPLSYNLGNIEHPPTIRRTTASQFWLQSRPLYYTDIYPGTNQLNVNPVLTRVRQNTGFVNSKPSYYVNPSVVIPNSSLSFPNPQVRKVQNRGWIDYYTIDTSPAPPDHKPNYTLTVLIPGKRPHSSYAGWFTSKILTTSLPPVAQSTALPLRKRPFVPTWISSLQVNQAIPLKTYDYPNPVIIKRQTQTWINNNLLDVLYPGFPVKPFNQNDQPNPRIGLKNFHIGWIKDKPTYYTEAPLQPAQYDWPVFRPVNRNHVGFIHFRLQTGDPFFTSITEVPQYKKVLSLFYRDNPLLTIIAPTGAVPFNEYKWPLFYKIKYPISNLTLIGQNPIILPDIVGRNICLLADATEYNLEATLEPYDLEANATSYDLEAGGTECQ